MKTRSIWEIMSIGGILYPLIVTWIFALPCAFAVTVKAKTALPPAARDVGLLEFAMTVATAKLSEVGLTTTGAAMVPVF